MISVVFITGALVGKLYLGCRLTRDFFTFTNRSCPTQMKYILFLLLLLPSSLHAQKVYQTQYASDANLKVYVTQYASDADLIVYKEAYITEAKGNKGHWFFTQYASDADYKVFFTQYASDADLKIYYTQYPSDAGWRKKDKAKKVFGQQ